MCETIKPRALHVAFVCTPCCMLLDVVAQSLKPVKLFSQQLSTFLLFCDRRSVAQQCWIRLHGSSNIVGATHAHYAWITKTYGLYSSHDALQVPNLLGVVASVCTPLPTRTQQLPTLLAQQCWELLRPFARSLTFCGGREPKTTTLFFFSQTSIQSSRIQLQKNLPTLDKLNTMEYERKV